VAQNVTNWVWQHSRAVNGSLIVMLALADEAGRDGETAMSVLELAQKTRLSERSVQSATKDLARSGELRVRPKVGDHGRNGYQVIMTEPVRRGADIAPLTGAESAPPAVRRGADIAPPQNLHPAESAPRRPPKPQLRAVNPADSAPQPISDVLSSSTGRPLAEVKEVSEVEAERPDVGRLCGHLADRIEANGSKRPTITKRWRDAARLMLDNDGRTEGQVMSAIDWCQEHEFWRTNILSMPKLREKYDQMRLQASRKTTTRSRQADTDAQYQRQMTRAQAKEGHDTNRNGAAHPLRQSLLPATGDG
jgi:hypothetical protein